MPIGGRVRQIRKPIGGAMVLVWAGLLGAGAAAQDESVPTLRVYTDLVQIPTLVLNSNREPMPALAHPNFLVRIDGGPPFLVSHVRQEGEDPVAMAVLLDVNAMPAGELSRFPQTLAELAPKSFHPTDTVSVYMLDCQLVQAASEDSITPAVLQKTAAVALSTLQAGKKLQANEPCRRRWNLLDAIDAVTRGLSQQPARRVLLVITGGRDGGSKATWDLVGKIAQVRGAAIFAIVPPELRFVPGLQNPRTGAVSSSRPSMAVDQLNSLCAITGGMILNDPGTSLDEGLRDLLSLVRGRYILEFPRPAASVGMHNLDVSIENVFALVRPAGSSFPLPDPELEKDPNAIIPEPSKAPQVGRKAGSSR